MTELAHDPAIPLVVDLDGTLIRSDLLLESFFALASTAPRKALKALWQLRKGRAALKAELARHQSIAPATLPYNEELLTWLRAEQANGRTLYLASASNEIYVQQIISHIGLFSGIFASNDTINLKSSAKAAVLCQAFGDKQFDYVGNEKADLAVWEHAANIIVTNASDSFIRQVQQRFPNAKTIATPQATPRDLLKTLRPHQWLKNLLIFVPTLAAHQFELANLRDCIIAFISFSLCASSGYILNDLLDLRNDRQHPTKRHRAFAAGRLNLYAGVKLLIILLAVALFMGLLLSATFILVLFTYYALTLLYSTIVKRRMILDVIFLSLLYGTRLVAGGIAVTVPLSAWLLSFATFFFLSLALIKRCTELVTRQTQASGDPKGRDYRLTDLPMLESMAAASGYVAALTSGLYISSQTVSDLYNTPQTLWAIPIVLLFWISRLLLLTHRGDMHDDPVLFAARDRTSIICGALILLVLFISM